MSKLARKPISIQGATVVTANDILSFKGKLGTYDVPMLPHIKVEIKESEIQLTNEATNAQARANWGTMASLIRNAVTGVTEGFEKKLQLEGIGMKAVMSGTSIVFSLGFTHDITFVPPDGITLKVEKNIVSVFGIDKVLVGETAARIRKLKKPEPYKGKGIRYVGEVVRRKAGKKVAGAGADAKK